MKGKKSVSSDSKRNKPKIIFSSNYLKRLEEIEIFIWFSSDKSLSAFDFFFSEHERVLEFLQNNPHAPSLNPKTGIQSWPFGGGRYRLFFLFDGKVIILTTLIDNRMNNSKFYSPDEVWTYDED